MPTKTVEPLSKNKELTMVASDSRLNSVGQMSRTTSIHATINSMTTQDSFRNHHKNKRSKRNYALRCLLYFKTLLDVIK